MNLVIEILCNWTIFSVSFFLDIAVGAYASSNVVLLFGQPVIRMTTWIEIAVAGDTIGNQDKVMIKRDSHTIAINTCFRFTDNIDTHSIGN